MLDADGSRRPKKEPARIDSGRLVTGSSKHRLGAHIEGAKSIALQRSIAPRCHYTVTVITDNVGDAVQAAGGWMTDRVRAGWHVAALIPAGSDATPLRILGVSTKCFESETDPAVLTPIPATLALRAPVLHLPNSLRYQVRALMEDLGAEITVWGAGQLESSRRFDAVQHRLSAAAQAFKSHALRAAALEPTTTPIELFRSCARWYRLDIGADFEPVNPSEAESLQEYRSTVTN